MNSSVAQISSPGCLVLSWTASRCEKWDVGALVRDQKRQWWVGRWPNSAAEPSKDGSSLSGAKGIAVHSELLIGDKTVTTDLYV